MRVACPGSFDPITVGHLDIIERAHRLFGDVVVAVGAHSGKNTWFSADERVALIVEATQHLPGVTVSKAYGLMVDFVVEQGCDAIVRGIRCTSDFDYEFQMSHMNRYTSAKTPSVGGSSRGSVVGTTSGSGVTPETSSAVRANATGGEAGSSQAIYGVETLLMPSDPQWSFISSSMLREIALNGGDVSQFVTPAVNRAIMERAELARNG